MTLDTKRGNQALSRMNLIKLALIGLGMLIFDAVIFHLGTAEVAVLEPKTGILVNGSIRADGKVVRSTFGDLIVSAHFFYLL